MGLDWLLLGGAAIGAAAGVYNTFSQAQAQEDAARFQSAMASHNARIAARNAEVSRNQAAAQAAAIDAQTDAEVAALRRKNAFALSENRALLGASGVQNSGSSLLFEIDNAITASVDEQNTLINGRYKADLQRYEGEVKGYQFETEAANYAAQSKYYAASARNAAVNKWISSPLSGLSGALSGAMSGSMLSAATSGLSLGSIFGGSLLSRAAYETPAMSYGAMGAMTA